MYSSIPMSLDGILSLTRNLQMFFLNTARSNICAKYKFLKRLFASNISFSFFNEILRIII